MYSLKRSIERQPKNDSDGGGKKMQGVGPTLRPDIGGEIWWFERSGTLFTGFKKDFVC